MFTLGVKNYFKKNEKYFPKRFDKSEKEYSFAPPKVRQAVLTVVLKC